MIVAINTQALNGIALTLNQCKHEIEGLDSESKTAILSNIETSLDVIRDITSNDKPNGE